MNEKSRPLSPHLGIYKPQISSVLSILHRFTGVANFFGMLLLFWWITYLPYLQEYFTENVIWQFFKSTPGNIVLILWTFSLFFHFCAGLRYLFLDAGKGFELKTFNLTGWVVVISSLFLTIITWIIIFRSI